MSFQIKKVIPFILVGILFIVLLFFWIRSGKLKSETSEEMRLPVITMQPSYGNISRNLELTGVIESQNQVTLLPRISGRLESVLVDVGDYVEEGDIVAQVDPEVYLLSLTQIEAAFRAAESSHTRVANLYRSGSTSEENYTRSKAQYESLQSQYELAKLQYEYTSLTSPVTGTVLIKHINAGSIVAQTIPVLTLGSLTELIVKVKVPEEYYPYFSYDKEGNEILVTHPSLMGEGITGTIKSVAPYISPESRNFEVTIGIDETENLRPGMLIYINFSLETREDSYYLPHSVITDGNKLWYVNSDSRAISLEYNNIFEANDFFQISEEYKDYNFIYEGQHFLSEGQAVNSLERPE